MPGPNANLRPFRLPGCEGVTATVLASAGTGEPLQDPVAWARWCLDGPVVSGERVSLKGEPLVLKRDVLGPSGARRHGLRRSIFRMHPPRTREFRNLEWLAERLFHVPEPVAAVTIWSGRKPVRQMLVTRELPGARTLADAWSTGTEEERSAWAEELGSELGRMHALHFLHADLYPRNVLVVGQVAVASGRTNGAGLWPAARMDRRVGRGPHGLDTRTVRPPGARPRRVLLRGV